MRYDEDPRERARSFMLNFLWLGLLTVAVFVYLVSKTFDTY